MDIQVNKRVEPYTEEKARKYFRDIVLGLEYCMLLKYNNVVMINN